MERLDYTAGHRTVEDFRVYQVYHLSAHKPNALGSPPDLKTFNAHSNVKPSDWLAATEDVRHQVAAVYESRDKAIYWHGRNEFGEQITSGVYFYHLNTGNYSQTQKMIKLK